jgi:predicted alpha/beta hydrolase family esterase
MFLTHITRKATSSVKHHVAVVHRWSGNPNADWYQGFCSKVKEFHSATANVDVHVLEMPNPNVPQVNAWTERIKYFIEETQAKNASEGQEQVFHLVGHSVGCNAVLRVASDMVADNKANIGGVMLVAGWLSLNAPWHTAKPWCVYEKDFYDRVKNTIGHNTTLLVSDNDPYLFGEELEKNKDVFREKMGVESIVQIDGGSHFTNAEDADVVFHVADVPH